MKRWMVAVAVFACATAFAQAPTKPLRLRGAIQSFDGSTLVVKERSGEVLNLVVASDLSVTEVLPIEISAIQPGSYIGSGAMPASDGTLNAVEVVVFPEASRGTGEGFSAWDFQPGGTMTNATVTDVVTATQGRTLKVRYKDGEKVINVPDSVPVVTLKPADRSLLVEGAKVIVVAQLRGDKPTALRVIAGRDGFAPPM